MVSEKARLPGGLENTCALANDFLIYNGGCVNDVNKHFRFNMPASKR